MTEVIVIGGGAAGMMAALQCALSGGSVTLLEGNEKLGKKVYITGKGRCNLTNDCTLDEFMQQVAHNPRFLYSALNAFTPQDMMSLLEENGCPVVVQRGRRVFPATEKASDVTRTLSRLMQQAGVKVRLNTKVQDLLVEDGQVQGVITRQGERLPAGQVILATGGQSYPVTGSDGDGFRLAEKLGHTVLPPTPVLSALVSNAEWVRRLQGLSLKNVTLTLQSGKKRLYREQGEMLFTHFGISGPLVLEMSCHLPEKLTEARVELNLKPALAPEQLDARLQREFTAQNRKQLRNVLPSLLPGKLAEEFPALAGVSSDTVCGQITKEDREKILHTLQCLVIPVTGLRPLAEAIVTRGGISVKEVTPSTMESKLVHGLYFAGELLDVDAHTGGYNLQIAWSTGAAAGRAAAAASFAQE